MTAVLISAHPYPLRSRANRRLLAAVRDVPGLAVRSLYDLYPDFDIDVEAEQDALAGARALIWQHPMYWYSVPGLMKHWFDKVLVRGFAYGAGGTALHGKQCLWAVTTGGDSDAFTPQGKHAFPLSAFTPVVQQTVRFCGMEWLEPFVVHGAHQMSPDELDAAADAYRVRVQSLVGRVGVAP